jgi:hypothetical protein
MVARFYLYSDGWALQMLTERRRQYQALEHTFCWTLEESAGGTSKICRKQNFLDSSLSIWWQKNARASGVA